MGFYRDHVFVRVMNVMMNTDETRRIRSLVCAGLAGEVIEVGFGTGLNLPHLPSSVTRLIAVDPLESGRERAAARLAATDVPVEFVGLDGRQIPLPDASVDAALTTWTLCSIPEPVEAVKEIRRVLRPGGSLHFAEHGRAPDADVKVQRWQNRLNGLQRRMACGCTLTTEVPAVIEAGGLEIQELETFYAKGDPKTHGWMFRGVATVAS